MTKWWDKQIQRADALAAHANGSKELLTFYAYLLRAQKDIYELLRGRKGWLPAGELEDDFPVLRETLPSFLKVVEAHGPESLASEAHDFSQLADDALAEKLMTYWHDTTDVQFFEKAFLQPYLKWLVETGGILVRKSYRGERYCPFCGGNPQVSFLQNKETTAESGNRDLICATCLSSWEFRRVVCASCGEERPAQLGYFHSPEFDHVRIEACDTCKRYIKGVDLTRVGFAAPLVDEIDAAPLDLWAREHGYTKIELNLVGI
ncbi:MAG TPA: formate dehydrogenase accessory protein FdhE [Pyrinomonadaceae bacterium]|jgi:formate dehydrogenase maturation protein FdhE|nr:formate dehydrogenase accessory protein FdhE [Pyrinomonadaceae bacterium]